MKKTAIVTGSSRGIGFAIAKQLGLDGFNIVMVATGPQGHNQAALDSLAALGIPCAYVQADVGDHEDRLRIVSEAVKAFGRKAYECCDVAEYMAKKYDIKGESGIGEKSIGADQGRE